MIGKNKLLLIFAARTLRCRDDLHLFRLVTSIPDGVLGFSHRLALSDIGFPTENIFYKDDIFTYLNREAPKYIRTYKKKRIEHYRKNTQELEYS